MVMSRHWLINKTISTFLFSFSLVFLSPVISGSLWSAERIPVEKPGGPISITSEKMTFKNLEDKILFEGSVVIKQEGVTINADRAEVFLSESDHSDSSLTGGNESRAVTQVITTGNVRIAQGRQNAKAEKGVYKKGEEVIVLTGHPEVWDDGFRVKGSVITFFIEEERIKVSESQSVIYNGAKGFSQD